MADFLLAGFGLGFIIAGLIGCILPVIPGPPLSYIGLLLLHLTSWVHYSTTGLLFWLVMVVAVTVLDYVIPAWGTKKFGGSKWGVWGSVLGLLIGLFFGPVGIFVGPFAGALCGELLYHYNATKPDNVPVLNDNQKMSKSLKAAFGSFVGLMAGIVLKLIVSFSLAYIFIREIVKAMFN